MASSPTQSEIWKDLAVKAQGGDKVAYAQLLKELLPYIKAVIIKTLSNPDWADDIAQEVLISVHKSLHTYRADRPFLPWLKAIINFRRTDYLRQHYKVKDQKEISSDLADFHDFGVTTPRNAGEYRDIENALKSLPKKQRKIFEMLKLQGHSVKEVANEMNMSESAVKVSSHRTIKKLQDKIGN